MSTTDLDEAPEPLPVLLPPPLPQAVPGDEPLARRGHPGGPGFAVPGAPAGASVWQRAQAAWLAAGAEWSGPARSSPPGPLARPAPARRARRLLLVAVAVVLVVAAAGGGYESFTAGRLGPRDYPAAQTGRFGTAQAAAGRGVFQALTQAASSGNTVVAVGSQAGGDLTRAQFFVSTDAGNTWRVAPVRAAAGG
ncbi:MAG TPA: hypothetical protein VH089_13710, partial [Streptosporangiaceae bacterium]|nr:hypothetical protein [Streptosporangiaceae bacterium]